MEDEQLENLKFDLYLGLKPELKAPILFKNL